ncbi:MAG: ion transporter [Akkermansia sp.]
MISKWRDSRGYAYFGIWESIIRVAILLWLVCFSLTSIPTLEIDFPKTTDAMSWYDFFLRLFFLAEYLLRIIISKKRIHYLLSPMGIVDFLVALPVILALEGLGQKDIMEPLRMMQLLCLLKFIRFNKAISPILRAFKLIKNEFYFFLTVFVLLLYVLGVGIFMAERYAQPEKFASVLDGLWFAVETLSTVGYGDYVPVTPLGKLFTGCIMFLGIALIAIPTGLITSAMTRIWQQRPTLKGDPTIKTLNSLIKGEKRSDASPLDEVTHQEKKEE